ncbi:YopX family protein [Aeribacillus sp. FSL K6-1121]|uniref:YopX family protein n=1 Tax=Aeribacillus sp. FSL K6-1121 TaxID=2954745 RepID=UPI0030F7C6CF
MNEIKFRVWSNQLNKMVYPNERGWFDKCFIGKNQFIQSCQLSLAIEKNGKELEVMQYTGLKDKNGREIYEGDILELGIQKGILKSVVEYHSPTFCHRWINLEGAGIRGKKIEPLFWNTNIIFEVIGNVYENPELLEGEE